MEKTKTVRHHIKIVSNDNGKTYDKVFKILDKHALLGKYDADKEYRDAQGYHLEFYSSLPSEALHEISDLKNCELV